MAFSSADPRNYLAMTKQADQDTEGTTGFKFLKYLGDSGFDVAQETEAIYEGGDGQDVGLVYKSRVRPDGQVVAYARPDMFAFLSAWALGSGVTPASVADTAVASHIYTPNATVPYLTLEQAWGGGNQIDRVRSAILTGFTLEGESGQPWRVTVPFVGGGTPYYRDGAASALTATLEAGDPAMYAGGAYLIASGPGIATTLDINRFTYTFSRNVDEDLFTTEVFRRKVLPLTRSAELTFQLIWQDQELYKRIIYNGGSMVDTGLATGAFRAVRNLTASQTLQVDIPNLKFSSVEVNRLEPDGQTVLLDVSAQAFKSGTGIVQHRANITGRATSYLVYP